MKAQRDEFFYSLQKHGWQAIEIEEFHFVPWTRDSVDEKWIIESLWRPVGFRAFVYFLVDPQTSPSEVRRKGEKVWAVRISIESAENRFDEEYEDFPIKKGHWNQSLKDIFNKLANWRQLALS